uniref:Uncharacterized protein n=1 Tax=Physcomitrium patens TaxID=3218 RepID=A0A7I3ZVY6_PHYPA
MRTAEDRVESGILCFRKQICGQLFRFGCFLDFCCTRKKTVKIKKRKTGLEFNCFPKIYVNQFGLTCAFYPVFLVHVFVLYA